MAAGTRSGCVRSARAASCSSASWVRACATASGPVIASMRRTFAALDPSLVTFSSPISAVERTCVPPHSSRDHEPSPISTMRTMSPYFSPNSAVAPSAFASSSVVTIGRTGSLPVIHALTWSSTRGVLVGQARAVGEVEAQLVGAHVGARLADVRAQPRPQRRVQQVRRGVVGRRRVARPAVDARDDALPRLQLARDRLDDDRLVVAQAQDVDDLRAAVAVLALDRPASATCPPPVA